MMFNLTRADTSQLDQYMGGLRNKNQRDFHKPNAKHSVVLVQKDKASSKGK